MAVNYTEVDATNLDQWCQPVRDFSKSLDVELRCNAAAVARQKWDLTYPSFSMIREFVDRDALVVVAHDGDEVVGYLICTDDRDRKYGGCYCRWIGLKDLPPEEMSDIYSSMGDIAVEKYGWLWGRVSNTDIRNFMINFIDGCELGIDGDDQIVTYKKP